MFDWAPFFFASFSAIGYIAQSAGAAEYTDCISAEGLDFSNKCNGYDTKQSDVDVP